MIMAVTKKMLGGIALLLAGAGASGAAEIELCGSGSKAETRYSEKFSVKRFTPYKISLEAKKADAQTKGRTLCAGLPGLNVDLALKEEWTSYSDIVMTPSRDKPLSDMAIRFSLWQVTGKVQVRNWSITEQQPVYASDDARQTVPVYGCARQSTSQPFQSSLFVEGQCQPEYGPLSDRRWR